MIYDDKSRATANAGYTPAQSYSYNRISDAWFVTSVDLFCENWIETSTVDDNSRESPTNAQTTRFLSCVRNYPYHKHLLYMDCCSSTC